MADVTISQVGSEITEPTGDEVFEVEVPGSPAEGAHMSLDTIAAYAGGGGGGGVDEGVITVNSTTLWTLLAPAAGGGRATGSLTVNALHFEPVVVQEAIEVDALAVHVQTAGTGGTVARLGIYRANDPLWTDLVLVVDAGTVAVDSTGLKTASFTATVLPPGRYYKVVAVDASTTLWRIVCGWRHAVNNDVQPAAQLWRTSVGTGALPGTIGAPTNANQETANWHAVMVRRTA